MASDNTLPDIPYTPMQDSNINDGASTSSAVDSPPVKRSRALTPAARKAKSRKAQSAEKKEATNAKDRADKAKAKEDQSVEKRQESTSRNTIAQAKARADQSAEKREATKEKNRAAMAKEKEDESVEKREASKSRNKAAQEKARADQAAEKREASKTRNAAAMEKARSKMKTTIKQKEALRVQEILQGRHKVLDLNNTEDTIGEMDNICEECGAHKFRKETGSTCCNNGKVQIPPFPKPPKEINNSGMTRLQREDSSVKMPGTSTTVFVSAASRSMSVTWDSSLL